MRCGSLLYAFIVFAEMQSLSLFDSRYQIHHSYWIICRFLWLVQWSVNVLFFFSTNLIAVRLYTNMYIYFFSQYCCFSRIFVVMKDRAIICWFPSRHVYITTCSQFLDWFVISFWIFSFSLEKLNWNLDHEVLRFDLVILLE